MNTETTSPDKIPAHSLWVEMTTRITTQPLHYRSGNEETAAKSVHSLFPKTRELMDKHPDAKRFQWLVLKLLNDTLRPYTARWHRWMTQSSVPDLNSKFMLVFKDEQVRRMFRAELIEVRQSLSVYLNALEALADGRAISEETQKALDGFGEGEVTAQLGADLDAGLPAAWAEINRREHEEITQRRKALDLGGLVPGIPLCNATGLALSGGGIRSATFCLGIVETLAKRDLFHQFDYLSTVSGGGYLGTFLSSALAGDHETDRHKSPRTIVEEVLDSPDRRSSSRFGRNVTHDGRRRCPPIRRERIGTAQLARPSAGRDCPE